MEFDDTEGIFRRKDNQRSENSRRHHHHHNEQDTIRLDFDTEEDRGALERNTDEANPSGERGVKRNREAANLGKNEKQPAEEEVEEDLEEIESVQQMTAEVSGRSPYGQSGGYKSHKTFKQRKTDI